MGISKKNPNYVWEEKDSPPKRMGEGEFANLPQSPKMMKFSNTPEMRGGIINSFTCNIQEISNIEENC